MRMFEINDKEYELKLTYKAIKHLSGLFDGGSYELIGNAMQGDLETFPKIIHACLFHTKENIPLKAVESRIEELIDSEELSQEGIAKIGDEVIIQSFFFKATVNTLMKSHPEMKEALDQLRG